MEISGFRAHGSTTVEVRSPITAFCGVNGTGKTTLLHLAACAFKGDYRLSTFFAQTALDKNQFTASARVAYHVLQHDGNPRSFSLSRRATAKRWSDYRKRESRQVVFLGCGDFLPRVETKDFVFRNAKQLSVLNSQAQQQFITDKACRVLGTHYDSISENAIAHGKHRATLLSAARGAIEYSETNMGYGEGRVLSLTRRLETVPEKSLILLEEPEISLHQSAQFRFGEYLIDLSVRRGHQIFLSTHSEHILRALPQASRQLLIRTGNGLDLLPGLSSSQAASLMADGHDKALTVLVEDELASYILAEIVGLENPVLLKSIRAVVAGYRDDKGQSIAGGKDAIKAAMKTLRNSGLKVAALLDADGTEDVSNFVFKLPGSKAPEKEIFANTAVQAFWESQYRIDLQAFLKGLSVNHHNWFDALAAAVGRDPIVLAGEAARVYAKSLHASDVKAIVASLKEAMDRK